MMGRDVDASPLQFSDTKEALVADVTKGSPAEASGLQRGDVILGFDGKDVADAHALPALVGGNDSLLPLLRRGDATLFAALEGGASKAN